ncbi:MAG: FtsX-like permease family protein, partial [Longimicrobiales bacterium]|nr:FtsX-like permease family protein [Longimicrobiales bacterium]
GAGRGRLARQLLTESLILALVATALAAPLLALAGDVLPYLFPYRLAVSVDADLRVYAFLVSIGVTAGLAFGAAPAWTSVRRSLAGALRHATTAGGPSGTRLRDGLVVAQISLSLGLVAAAGLLGRSIMEAQQADAGFRAHGVVAAVVDVSATGRYDVEAGQRLFRDVLARAAAEPGVRSATLANQMPLIGGHSRASARPQDREDVSFEAEYVVVGPDYFETLGIPLLEGRSLGGLDSEPEPVVVVNSALASIFWPGGDAVGQEIEAQGRVWEVVGVVGDVQMRSLRTRANPAVYYPLAQAYTPYQVLHIAGVEGSGVTPEIARRVVAAVDPQLPVPTTVDLQAAAVRSMAETRTIGMLVAAFALLALTLAAIGLYGLVSYAAAQRVREMGIRLALGAEPTSLVRLVLARGAGITLVGIVAGLGVAFGLGSALQGLLFGVSRSEPAVLLAAAALLFGASAVAAWIPARRASRVDAAISLREG